MRSKSKNILNYLKLMKISKITIQKDYNLRYFSKIIRSITN